MAPPPDRLSSTHDAAPRPERRRHVVVVTQRAEYHLRDGVCVAVRRRGEEAFSRGHLCENRALVAGSIAQPGQSLTFAGPIALSTPIVVEVRRAPRADVERYDISA